MTSGCRRAEKDLCQTALMRSKTVIQFRAAVSWRRRIIKLRFADANRGIMGQLCKSLPIWKWKKSGFVKVQLIFFYFSVFLWGRKQSWSPKKAPQAACGPKGRPSRWVQVQEHRPNLLHKPTATTRTMAGAVFTIWRRFIIPSIPLTIITIPHSFRIWMWCAASPF